MALGSLLLVALLHYFAVQTALAGNMPAVVVVRMADKIVGRDISVVEPLRLVVQRLVDRALV